MPITLLLEDIRPGAHFEIEVDEDGNFLIIRTPNHNESVCINTIPVGSEIYSNDTARRCSSIKCIGSIVLELHPPNPRTMILGINNKASQELIDACESVERMTR